MAYYNDYEKLLQDIQSSGQNWSDYDLQLAKNDPDAGRSIFTQKQNYANAQTDAQRAAANAAAEAIRAQYGSYIGGSDGSGYTKIASGYQSDKTPNYAPEYTEYTSKYADQIDSLMNDLLNREAFSYSPAADPSFQALSERYRNLGNQSRKDVLGDAAAMTGGMPNSYAIAAAQQAQDSYNAQLTDSIPALQQLAYEMYLGDLEQDRADLSALMGLDDVAYGRHMDSYNAQLNKWQADYGVDRDIISDYRTEDNTQYERLMDRAALLAQIGDYSGYAALGLSTDQIAALNAAAAQTTSSGTAPDDNSEVSGETMHFNDYADFYYEIKDAIHSGNYTLAQSIFEANADRLTDTQYRNLMKLLD